MKLEHITNNTFRCKAKSGKEIIYSKDAIYSKPNEVTFYKNVFDYYAKKPYAICKRVKKSVAMFNKLCNQFVNRELGLKGNVSNIIFLSDVWD